MSSSTPSEEDEYGWGPSKAEYYGADPIETEQDAQMEEEETRRLQQKRLQGMTEADFGFDQSVWGTDEDKKAHVVSKNRDLVTEKLPQLHITADMGPQRQLELLQFRYPEFEHLKQELLALQPVYEALGSSCGKTNAEKQSSQPKTTPNPVRMIKYQALSAYMASLAMYFALLASPTRETGTDLPKSPQELRKHPIMDYLLKSRELWQKVEEHKEPEIYADTQSVDDFGNEESPHLALDAVAEDVPKTVDRKRKRKRSKAQRATEVAAVEAEAQRQERVRKTQEDLAGLSVLLKKPSNNKSGLHASPKTTLTVDPNDSDFGEETALTAEEAAEKARKKKTLRFYTSQIAQKANMRGTKGRAAGGDDDLPYRERLKDRQARLNEQAEKRGRKAKEAQEQLGGDSDEEDRRVAKNVRDEPSSDSDDDYYDMVAARTKKKKADHQERAEAYAVAKAHNARVVEVEELGPDGKRKVSYAIEKNKGLTPFRKKDVRNPRVKKRKKFEEKKKKLGSIKPVWKGGEGKGGYGGERTGIKTSLIRSVKL